LHARVAEQSRARLVPLESSLARCAPSPRQSPATRRSGTPGGEAMGLPNLPSDPCSRRSTGARRAHCRLRTVSPSFARDQYFGAWLVIGLGMGGGPLRCCIRHAWQAYGSTARSAITTLTLEGGFASTVCWPLSALLVEHVGWPVRSVRGTREPSRCRSTYCYSRANCLQRSPRPLVRQAGPMSSRSRCS
jgi:hypothetical protein